MVRAARMTARPAFDSTTTPPWTSPVEQHSDDARVEQDPDARAGEQAVGRLAPYQRVVGVRPGLAVELGLGQLAALVQGAGEPLGEPEDDLLGNDRTVVGQVEPADGAGHAGNRATAEPVPFHEDHGQALLRGDRGRGDPGRPAADHDDVDGGEGGDVVVGARNGRVDPPAGELAHDPSPTVSGASNV